MKKIKLIVEVECDNSFSLIETADKIRSECCCLNVRDSKVEYNESSQDYNECFEEN